LRVGQKQRIVLILFRKSLKSFAVFQQQTGWGIISRTKAAKRSEI
jgi:hypothetical protein